MTSPSADTIRYGSLSDYLAVLRRYALLIVIVTVLGGVAGYVTAKRQTPQYASSATIAFQDPTQALSIVGLGTSSSQTPAQLAAIAAETLTRPQLMIAVQRRLHTSVPASSLGASVSASVSSSSGLLGVSAVASSPAFATSLTNAVASELVAQDNAAARARFRAIAADVRSRIASLGHPKPNSANSTQLAVYQDELARLVTLASFATTAQVAESAQPSFTPISPNVSRSTVIGLVLGLMLGLVAAFTRDAVDRRLRGGDDIGKILDFPIVGHVRAQALGRLEYLADGRPAEQGVDLESFRILRRNVEVLDRQGTPRVILVTSPAPEDGKTTVAGSLAYAMASSGRRTLLVDADLRRATLTTSLGIDRSPGLTDYLSGVAAPQDIVRLRHLGETTESGSASEKSNGNGHAGPWFAFIPAGAANPHAAELLGSDRLREFISQVSEQYDAVVLDSSPLLPVADTLELLPHADAILLCARSSRLTRDEAAATRAVLSRYPERPTGIVVTGVRARTGYEGYPAAYQSA